MKDIEYRKAFLAGYREENEVNLMDMRGSYIEAYREGRKFRESLELAGEARIQKWIDEGSIDLELCGEYVPAPGSFAEKVQRLDALLTGKNVKEVAHTWRNNLQAHNPLEWLTVLYYLSDGGYSRVFFRLSDFTLQLASGSRQEVSDKFWSTDCRNLAKEVENEIKEALNQ